MPDTGNKVITAPLLLAVATETVTAPTGVTKAESVWSWLRSPWILPEQNDLLHWCANMNPGAATILLVGGIVYLLFGWYMFKWLVTLNSALVGAYIGSRIGSTSDAAVAGAFMGGFAAAVATWPLMKYAVTIMGGLFGVLLGVSVWRTCGLDPQYAWSGGLTGLIFFGMLSFLVFRASVIAYTSLQGSVMLIFGMLSLIYKSPDFGSRITEAVTIKPFILPIAIFIPMVAGLFYQSQGGGEVEVKKK